MTDTAQAGRRIVFDGLNLALTHGTGIATYARVLTHVARELGHDVGIVYSAPHAPPKTALGREVTFFDAPEAADASLVRGIRDGFVDQIAYLRPVKPKPVSFSGAVVTREFAGRMPAADQIYTARNLFDNAQRHFSLTSGFANLKFETRPDIFHCTYQLPLRVKSACNIYTIHDLIPMRLPFTTLDNKRYMLRLLQKIAKEADHIVTVSENSKRDIIEFLGVEERRVTNTYQSIVLPSDALAKSEAQLADQLSESFSLDLYEYLLFFGALEPKKNVARLVEAYGASGVDIPLVIVAAEDWQPDSEKKFWQLGTEKKFFNYLRAIARAQATAGRRIQRIDYVSLANLTTLIRGARAVLFPSLYEGFGLPVLEAMALGTPVITSTEASVPEVAGDAALLVDPYDTAAIAKAINTIVADPGLRSELAQRGKAQAEKFSVERYRERVRDLYASLR